MQSKSKACRVCLSSKCVPVPLVQMVIYCVGAYQFKTWILDKTMLKTTLGEFLERFTAVGDLSFGCAASCRFNLLMMQYLCFM